jgi:hypothetical protein
MATPFFWVFLYEFTIKRSYATSDYLVVLFLSNAFWLLFGSYVHIMQVVYFNFGTAILLMYMYSSRQREGWPPLAIAAINVFIQVHMFGFFIEGGPIG